MRCKKSNKSIILCSSIYNKYNISLLIVYIYYCGEKFSTYPRKVRSASGVLRGCDYEKTKSRWEKIGLYLKKIRYALCTMQSRFFYVNDTRAGTAVHGKNWERAMHGYITYTHVILYTICLYLSIYFLKFLYILYIYI